MATTRSKTLGCGSLSSWIKIVRLSTMIVRSPRRVYQGRLLVEWVLQGVLARQDLIDLGLAAHRPLDGELGRLVVVLVDLVVILRLPLDEDAPHNDQIFHF